MSSKYEFPKFVEKKDGNLQRFDPGKIERSVHRALHHMKGPHELSRKITADTWKELNKRRKEVVNVGKIEDTVSKVLRKNGLREAVEYYNLVFLHIPRSKLKSVIKRDGSIQKFDSYKIFKAIRKSFSAVGLEDGKRAEKLTKEVLNVLNKKFHDGVVPSTEVKAAIEHVLVKNKLHGAARLYTLYRYS